MTLDEVLQILAENYTVSVPDRSTFSDSGSVVSCVYEIQRAVAETPSLANYVAYLNIKNAVTLLEIAARKAELVFKAVADVELSQGSEEDLNSAIQNFFSAQDQCQQKVSSSYQILDLDVGVESLRGQIQEYAGRSSLDPNTKEVFSLVADTIPISATGKSFAMSSNFLIKTIEEGKYVLTYNGKTVKHYGLITKGCLISERTVTYSGSNYFSLSGEIEDNTQVSIEFPVWEYSPAFVPYNTNRKLLLQYMLESSLPIDTSANSVRACIRGFGLSGISPDLLSFSEIEFDTATISAYEGLSSICYKWKQPQILEYVHDVGFNLSNINALLPQQTLADTLGKIGRFTDTRGLIV